MRNFDSKLILFFILMSLSCCGSKENPAPIVTETETKESEEAKKKKEAEEATKKAKEKAEAEEKVELEDIGEKLQIPLVEREISKYCRFIEFSMIEDLAREPDKRQYTLEKYMRDDGTKNENIQLEDKRLKLIQAHVKMRDLLCDEENSFEGFNITDNSSEITILKILSIRHLWSLVTEQNMPLYIRSISNTYKTSFSVWEKAFGSPEKVLWKKFFKKHSKMQESDYLARVTELSNLSKATVENTFLLIFENKAPVSEAGP